MQIQNIEEKINKAIYIIGSIPNYYNEITAGLFDEELACLFFKTEFSKIPVNIEDLNVDTVIESINNIKNKISLKLKKEEELIIQKKNEKVIENFRFMNKTSSLGTIEEISVFTGLSKTSLRKAKKEGYLSDLVKSYYPSYVSFNEFKEVANKIQLCVKYNFDIASFIGVNEIELPEFTDLIDQMEHYSFYNEKDFIFVNVNIFNKYKNRILKLEF